MTCFIVDYDTRANTPEAIKDFERAANRQHKGLYRLNYMWTLKFAVMVLGKVALTRDRDDIAIIIGELFDALHALQDFPDMAEPMAEEILAEVNRLAAFLPDEIVLDETKPRRCEILDYRHGAMLVEIK